MAQFISGEIVPGKRIGQMRLGWSFEALKNNLNEDYVIENLNGNKILVSASNSRFWIDTAINEITQIGIFGCFDGKFLDIIGIGSTLSDVTNHIGNWSQELEVYVLQNYPGICFELLDEDDWDELKAPIEYIYIYKIES